MNPDLRKIELLFFTHKTPLSLGLAELFSESPDAQRNEHDCERQ